MQKFAISDLHGCRKTFAALIDKIELTPADELYLLGDYIDRGPDSKGVIDLIWQLQQNGYKIHCLRGNHEQMLLDLYQGAYRPYYDGDESLLASFGVKHAKNIPVEYITWMDQLTYYFAVDEYLLVHAGFNFNTHDPLSDTTSMLWIRDWRADIDREWLNGRIVVHGHTPTRKESILHSLAQADTTPEIFIDNGCAFHHTDGLGRLCALDLQKRQLTFQEYIG